MGVNNVIVSSAGGSLGIGFAIPINQAKAILPELQAKGRVTRGWLGVSFQPVTPDLIETLRLAEAKGAVVAHLMPDSPAAKAGIRVGDVIAEYEGRPVAKRNDLARLVAAKRPGREVRLTVVRRGKSFPRTVQIGREPEPGQLAGDADAPPRPWVEGTRIAQGRPGGDAQQAERRRSAMVTVTERAKDALLSMKEAEDVGLPEVGLRLAREPSGQFGLVPDMSKPGDQVVEHQGSKVLLIGSEFSADLAGMVIDCHAAPEGTELVLLRPSGQNGGPPS